MDLQDQLKNLFPDHLPSEDKERELSASIWIQDYRMIGRYEKRKGKATTIIEGYTGANSDYKQLAKEIKQLLGVGGSFKNEQIIIQGDYRDRIMDFLKAKGFKTKRVGG